MSNQDNEELDSQNQSSEEDVKTTEAEDSSTQEDDKGEASETETDKDSEVYKRMKKAEAEAKELKKKIKDLEQNSQTNQAQSIDPDELKLIAKGLSDEEIAQAKIVAKGLDKPLSEAIKHDLFLTFQKDIKEKEKREKANLGASKGSGQQETNTPYRQKSTRDEHMAQWKKDMGIK